MLRRRTEPPRFAITSETLDALYRSHAPGMAVYIARKTMDAGVGADLTAETFAQAFTNRNQFRGRTREEAIGWLYGIARHQVSHFVRRDRAEARALERLGIQRPHLSDVELERLEDLAGISDLRRRIASHLSDLSHEQQEALRLRVLEEQSYEQMAQQLGINEQAVRARVSRGMRALAERLSPDAGEIREFM
ncbi:MAG TPA: RNA polymerase sigma factor [Baekduia sp.]|uniref:RNA polymerase sigma factor n=1 Tax=Baekduia sp. TaxID=2600305 RepID=UPI002D7A1D52|nr:RNA polymerase sigma factor [Baekduia sp.]HET6509305.1 RNA polymerase sigma factor [Baekduia sp.]